VSSRVCLTVVPGRFAVPAGLPIEKLHPSGKRTIAGMVAKGWVERRSDDHGRAVYYITATGQAALKAPIPVKR
jgi:hypothetical protein